jgi:hypothetical protein
LPLVTASLSLGLMGGKVKDMPPGIGTRQEILAKYGLPLLELQHVDLQQVDNADRTINSRVER